MVFCDIASFYSPRGGGVATYHDRKLEYFFRHPEHRYVMIAPAAAHSVTRVPGGTIYRLGGFRFDANYRHLYDPVPLRRVLREVRPDVLEFGSPYVDYWAASAAARKLDAVRTAYYHADFPDTYVRPFLRRSFRFAERPVMGLLGRYVRRVFGRLDATIAASRYILEKLRGLGLANTVHIPLGVDTATFRPERRSEAFRRELGLGPGGKLLLFTGRYRADKGIRLLFSALPALLEDPDVHVAFAGAGPLEPSVRGWAARHRRVRDLGYVGDRARLAALYASADAFLSPGDRETFGFGILEAVASGVPVVSADAGAGAEMVSRLDAGLLFRAGRAEDLGRAARELVRTDLGARLSKARKVLEEEYGWDRVFEAYIDHHGTLR